jgi:uncharacterized protein with ParB-like and HNH nuclease domain
MAINNQKRELKSIFIELEENKLVLPNFQRAFVWERDKQKSLVASLLVSLPVGSLLVLDGKSDDFTKRRLCYPDDLEIAHDCEYVLDGQQRLSTLRTVFYDVFEKDSWELTWKYIYGKLKNRWFIRVLPKDTEEDVFGIKDLHYNPLERLVDNDIVDFIEVKQIHKTKKEDIHHPVYSPLDNNGAQITKKHLAKNALANKFADKGLVPLYELSETVDGLHRKVISKIAQHRIDELKALAKDEGHSVDFYGKYFDHISTEEIELIIDENKDEQGLINDHAFTELWANLKAEWVTQFSSDLEAILNKPMSVIHLDRQEVERAVAIFEAINRGGVPLTVYDLIVAKSARNSNIKNLSSTIIDLLQSKFEVAEHMNKRYFQENKNDENIALWDASELSVLKDNEPSNRIKEWFVNVLSLLVYTKDKNKECKVDHIKRQKILNLSSEDVNKFCNRTVIAIKRALCFLQLRCGVVKSTDVQYSLMLVVIAYYLDDDSVWGDSNKQSIIEYWYWCALLGGAYASRQNERCIDDILQLEKMLSGDKLAYSKWESSVLNYQDYATKDILLRRDSDNDREQGSVKNAILQFLISRCPEDFIINSTGDSDYICSWKIAQEDIIVELHHVIPLGTETKISESTSYLRKKQKSYP